MSLIIILDCIIVYNLYLNVLITIDFFRYEISINAQSNKNRHTKKSK